MTGLLRTGARVVVASALVVGSVPLGGAVGAADVRTDTKLAGFAVTVEGSPLRVLVDDPTLAVPHDPGTAVVEGDPNYTLASVAAGPNARAVTSTLWPGNLFGEGLAQVAPGAPSYPIKGEARYPDKPYSAKGVDGGALSSADALGLDAHATANGTPNAVPGQASVGDATSISTATVTSKDQAVGTGLSAVKDVNLLGLIHIDSVSTTLLTQSDGKNLVSSGTTTVSGLTIAGQAFTVDDKGLHASGQGSALPGLATPQQVADALGISAMVLDQSVTKTSNGVSRKAGGLVIDINTVPLRKQSSAVTAVTDPVLNQVIGSLPPEYQGNFYYLVGATPHITFILAEANSSSAATQPLVFSFPGFGTPGFPPAPGGFSGSPAVVPPGAPNPATGAVITPGIADIPGGSAVVPRLADQGGGSPVFQPPAVAAASDTDFAGIGAGPVLGAIAGAGLIGWLLMRLLGLAGGGLLGCRLGAPMSLPNLRSVTA